MTSELDLFVSTKVASGRYTSASEVVREALRLLEERDQARDLQIAAFNRELSGRLASLDRRELVEASVVRDRIMDRSKKRKRLPE
ncbi:MAG: type II toxin-antitoxin system ParD family antitoxin [Acidobacteriaceae bacterium]|nr:type II toxin-antitoxin system ParD family antitoxin [Acidobacteriaceae bacterium]